MPTAMRPWDMDAVAVGLTAGRAEWVGVGRALPDQPRGVRLGQQGDRRCRDASYHKQAYGDRDYPRPLAPRTTAAVPIRHDPPPCTTRFPLRSRHRTGARIRNGRE